MSMNTHERKRKQNFTRFAALVAFPGDLVAGVVLPAGGKLYASSAVALSGTKAVVTAGTEALSVPAVKAGEAYPLGYAERDVKVSKVAGVTEPITLYVEGHFGVPVKIAQG